jgi:hypothetical protein
VQFKDPGDLAAFDRAARVLCGDDAAVVTLLIPAEIRPRMLAATISAATRTVAVLGWLPVRAEWTTRVS